MSSSKHECPVAARRYLRAWPQGFAVSLALRLSSLGLSLLVLSVPSLAAALDLASRIPVQSLVNSSDQQDLQLIAALELLLSRIMEENPVPGLNIALARGGKIVWQGAYGYADVAAHRPMTTDTVFHSGSLAKAYAGIAVMQLVERGSLKLDDPINEYLPFEVTNPFGGPPVTTRHLLTHTSGLGSSATDAMSYLCDNPRTVQDLERRLRSVFSSNSTDPTSPLSIWTQPTGTHWQYSNLGAALLGLIVERVNAEHLSYSTYVQHNIMDRLGMRYAQIPIAQTRQLTRTDIWKRLSVGYQTMGSAWIPNAPVCFGSFPCGGSFATPADYLRVLMATMQGGSLDDVQLLSRDSVKQMLTPATFSSGAGPVSISDGDEAPREQQGLIWQLRDWNSAARAFHHGGGHMYGWRTMAMAFPGSTTAFVVASNRWSSLNDSSPEIDTLTSFIEAWLQATVAGRAHTPPETWQIPTNLREQTLPKWPQPKMAHMRWKASYLRGLLFAEGYQLAIKTPQRLTAANAQRIAQHTAAVRMTGSSALWDSRGFVAGVRDMAALAATPQAVRDFASSGQMKITLAEARQLYALFDPNPGSDATLAGLLTIAQVVN